MKTVSMCVAILFVTCAPVYAQTGLTGTWRVESVGRPFPWEVVLKADGTSLSGTVNSCASVQTTIEIFDGKIDGNTIMFKCLSGDGRRTLSLTGKINGDEIAFTQVTESVDAAGALVSSAPSQSTAKRVRVGDLPKVVDDVSGLDFVAAVNLLPKDIKVEGTLFMPPRVRRVRAVLVVIDYGSGGAVLEAPEWAMLSETLDAALLGARFGKISRGNPQGLAGTDDIGRAEALINLLERLAKESGHQELIDAPLLFWGHSLGASAAAAFAARFPERTLAFVRYHGTTNLGAELSAVSNVPGLLLSGGKEENPLNAAGTEAIWRRGRAVGAPWTFAVNPDATHGGGESLKKEAEALMIPWITAVVRQSLSPDGKALRAVTDASAWLGQNSTGEVAPYGMFTGSKPEASWLPDEPVARAWQIVLGAK